MTEQILPNLYRIEVPLPGSPLKATNSYVIKTPGRNLIIDTGFNRDECIRAMSLALRELDVDLGQTDFFVTHMHSDHLGLVPSLATENSRVYVNQRDADTYYDASSIGYIERTRNIARMNGFPESELEIALYGHPGYQYRPRGRLQFTFLKEGDTIIFGEYTLNCVETPGHTKGHMCLYERNEEILVVGDHILENITPNITLWSDEWNPLSEYLKSLSRVCQLNTKLVLPGHRRVFRDCRKRIRELQGHHQVRAEEVLSILRKKASDAYKVASQMSWDIHCDSWDKFPTSQKWFATGEAISHLKYLEEKRSIHKEIDLHKIIYSLK